MFKGILILLIPAAILCQNFTIEKVDTLFSPYIYELSYSENTVFALSKEGLFSFVDSTNSPRILDYEFITTDSTSILSVGDSLIISTYTNTILLFKRTGEYDFEYQAKYSRFAPMVAATEEIVAFGKYFIFVPKGAYTQDFKLVEFRNDSLIVLGNIAFGYHQYFGDYTFSYPFIFRSSNNFIYVYTHNNQNNFTLIDSLAETCIDRISAYKNILTYQAWCYDPYTPPSWVDWKQRDISQIGYPIIYQSSSHFDFSNMFAFKLETSKKFFFFKNSYEMYGSLITTTSSNPYLNIEDYKKYRITNNDIFTIKDDFHSFNGIQANNLLESIYKFSENDKYIFKLSIDSTIILLNNNTQLEPVISMGNLEGDFHYSYNNSFYQKDSQSVYRYDFTDNSYEKIYEHTLQNSIYFRDFDDFIFSKNNQNHVFVHKIDSTKLNQIFFSSTLTNTKNAARFEDNLFILDYSSGLYKYKILDDTLAHIWKTTPYSPNKLLYSDQNYVFYFEGTQLRNVDTESNSFRSLGNIYFSDSIVPLKIILNGNSYYLFSQTSNDQLIVTNFYINNEQFEINFQETLNIPIFFDAIISNGNIILYANNKIYWFSGDGITDIQSSTTNIPNDYKLFQNYPNPFNASTQINYSVPIQAKINIKIYDILGNEISTLINEVKNPGEYNVVFDMKNLSSGVYLYKLETEKIQIVKKLVLLK